MGKKTLFLTVLQLQFSGYYQMLVACGVRFTTVELGMQSMDSDNLVSLPLRVSPALSDSKDLAYCALFVYTVGIHTCFVNFSLSHIAASGRRENDWRQAAFQSPIILSPSASPSVLAVFFTASGEQYPRLLSCDDKPFSPHVSFSSPPLNPTSTPTLEDLVQLLSHHHCLSLSHSLPSSLLCLCKWCVYVFVCSVMWQHS